VSFFRAAFLLLVFANLAFYAWVQGYFGGIEQGREPQRLTNQLAADKLRIVPAAPAGAVAGPATKPVAQGACRLVSGIPLAEADAFKVALAGLSVDIKPVEAASSYWVHIPSQPNKAAAEKKAAELKALGIKDFYIVQDAGANLLALSLGLFKSEAAANEFLQGLVKRGVKSARIEVREATPQLARAIVKGAAESLNQRLPPVLEKLPGASVGECP
jgi:hypothetical protein